MAKDKLTGRVSYRLGGQVFRQVERLAAAQDISANEWCRQAVIEKLKSESPMTLRTAARHLMPGATTDQSQVMTRGERILLEEILRFRYMVYKAISSHLGSMDGLTMNLWQSVVTESNGGPNFREMLQKFLEYHGVSKPTR
jgi:hypothetical protein